MKKKVLFPQFETTRPFSTGTNFCCYWISSMSISDLYAEKLKDAEWRMEGVWLTLRMEGAGLRVQNEGWGWRGGIRNLFNLANLVCMLSNSIFRFYNLVGLAIIKWCRLHYVDKIIWLFLLLNFIFISSFLWLFDLFFH